MSSSSTRTIPIAVRRAEPGALLPTDYGVTPHGTIFSTTPGGTRIIYDRNKLLSLQNSPFSQTPPAFINVVPGVTKASVSCTSPLATNSLNISELVTSSSSAGGVLAEKDEEPAAVGNGGAAADVFEMDME